MTDAVLIAVDGGNSKTHLAVFDADGEVLALVRGPLSSPHHLGLDAAVDVVERLLAQGVTEAALPPRRPLARLAALQLAGLDFPAEERAFEQAARARGWAKRLVVGNYAFALLRAGSESGVGVAVVCGAGINCVGVGPDGRHTRFPALGAITGDWGGGFDVGLAAVSAAARSEDGRGPRSILERAVPTHFGLRTPLELAQALHGGRIPVRRVVELPPVVVSAAPDDEVAAGILDRLAAEVVTFARAALERLDLLGGPADVILGGGILTAPDRTVARLVELRLLDLSPAITTRVVDEPPIVGAALLALDAYGADEAAAWRVRHGLVRAVRLQAA